MTTYTIVGESVEQSKKESVEFIKRLPEGFQPPQKSFLELKYELLKTMEESSSLLGENPYGVRSSVKRCYNEVFYYDRNYFDYPWQNKRQKSSQVVTTPVAKIRKPNIVNSGLKLRTCLQYHGGPCRSERQIVICGNVQSADGRCEKEQENQARSEVKCKSKLARWLSARLHASGRQSKQVETFAKECRNSREVKRKGCWSWLSMRLFSRCLQMRNEDGPYILNRHDDSCPAPIDPLSPIC